MSPPTKTVAEEFFPPRTQPTQEQIDANMQTVLTLQTTARTLHAKRPFAAILIGPDHNPSTPPLLTHTSLSHVDHAESSLARLAANHFSQHYLWRCTLYSTWEPCAMCTATCYWANIGRIVFGASNEALFKVTGEGNRENFGMRWGCGEVLAGGQKEVEVLGPLGGWEDRVVEDAEVYWKGVREKAEGDNKREEEEEEGAVGGGGGES